MLSPWKILGTLDCCCTGMPQLTKRCPLSPWYAAAPRSRERSTDTRRRQDESIGSLKAMKTCKYQFFNRMPEKLKKIPIPLKHIQKYCLLERDGNSQTPILYICLSIISNHTNSTFCLLQQPICMRKTLVLGESGSLHHQQRLIWTVGWSVM